MTFDRSLRGHPLREGRRRRHRSRSTVPTSSTRSGRRRATSSSTAFEDAWADRTIGAVILTGAGDRAFCTGGDVSIRTEDGYDGPTEPARHRPRHRGRALDHPRHPQAGDRRRQRLRHRRRARAPRHLRPDDRRRHGPVRPGRPEGRQRRPRVRHGLPRPDRRREEGAGDLVPLRAVQRRGVPADGARQQGRAGRRADGRRRGLGATHRDDEPDGDQAGQAVVQHRHRGDPRRRRAGASAPSPCTTAATRRWRARRRSWRSASPTSASSGADRPTTSRRHHVHRGSTPPVAGGRAPDLRRLPRRVLAGMRGGPRVPVGASTRRSPTPAGSASPSPRSTAAAAPGSPRPRSCSRRSPPRVPA